MGEHRLVVPLGKQAIRLFKRQGRNRSLSQGPLQARGQRCTLAIGLWHKRPRRMGRRRLEIVERYLWFVISGRSPHKSSHITTEPDAGIVNFYQTKVNNATPFGIVLTPFVGHTHGSRGPLRALCNFTARVDLVSCHLHITTRSSTILQTGERSHLPHRRSHSGH